MSSRASNGYGEHWISRWLVADGEMHVGVSTLSHRNVNRFNQREVARALKAARLAGERPDRVEIDPATGRITVILTKVDDVKDEDTPERIISKL